MDSFANTIKNLITTSQPYVVVIVMAVLLIIGIFLIIPSEELHRKALKALPFVVIGCGIALGAVVIGQWIFNQFSF